MECSCASSFDDVGAELNPDCVQPAEAHEELEVRDDDGWCVVGSKCEAQRAELAEAVAALISDIDEDEEAREACESGSGSSTPCHDVAERSDGVEPDDDDWVLDIILKRRQLRGGTYDTYDDDGHRVKRQHEYLCKWKWYAEPTWETREYLEDLGYVCELDAFDGRRLPMHSARVCNNQEVVGLPAPVLRESSLERLVGGAPQLLETLLALLSSSHLTFDVFASVGDTKYENQFLKWWHARSDSHSPVIVFSAVTDHNADYLRLSSCQQICVCSPHRVWLCRFGF